MLAVTGGWLLWGNAAELRKRAEKVVAGPQQSTGMAAHAEVHFRVFPSKGHPQGTYIESGRAFAAR